MSDVLQAAQGYLARGWRVVPVPGGTKAPRLPGWQDLRLTPDDLPHHFGREPVNTGVLMGEPSGGLVDVDIDCDEALRLADRLLPATGAVFGRPSRRASHRLYRAPGATTARWRDPDGTTLVELRATGCQTIMPPSVHPSGEIVSWVTQGEPAPVEAGALRAACQRLAAASLLARRWPARGGRHDAALALAGTLLRAGWREADAALFLEAVADAAGDEETRDRVRAVFSTARRLATEQPATGWPTFVDAVGEPVARQVAAWLGLGAGAVAADAARGEGAKRGRRSQADRLVELVRGSGIELWHTHEGAAFATFAVAGHRETAPLRSRGFRQWLARLFYAAEGRAAAAQAVQDALTTLEGFALFEGPEYAVFVRVAHAADAVYLDLGGPTWEMVKITPDGWRVEPHGEVRFRRPRGLGELPRPARGGRLDELRALVNVPAPDWPLLAGWLVATLSAGPYPVLVLAGEQGAGKSWLARLLRALVDPNTAPLRTLPRDERDLMIAASNAALICIDNVSGLPLWLSDALCRLATGGGFSTRELYTDDEERLFDAMRPVVITGIEEVATRPDLLDRAIVLTLPALAEEQRRPEAELGRAFEAARPRVLGALLDAVSAALRNRAHVQLARLPRMADFAIWATAAEAALGWAPGAFLAAYQGNRSELNSLALEASPVGEALLRLLEEDGSFEGTAAALLDRLAVQVGEAKTRAQGWPKTPRVLAGQLRRIAPNLRAAGFEVAFARARAARTITIRKGPQTSVTRVTSVTSQPRRGSARDAKPWGVTQTPWGVTQAAMTPPAPGSRGDARDAGDAKIPPSSGVTSAGSTGGSAGATPCPQCGGPSELGAPCVMCYVERHGPPRPGSKPCPACATRGALRWIPEEYALCLTCEKAGAVP
jgi:hypothetical protein